MTTPLREALDQLLALQTIDSERDKLTRKRAQLDTGASHKQRAADVLQESNGAREELTLTNSALKDAELEAAGVEDKIKRYEQQMRSGRVTNAREISNIERELNQLNRQRAALDEKILQLMEQSESGKTRVSEAEQRLQQAQRELGTQEELYRASRESLDAEINRLNAERSGAAAAVGDKALLQRYESIRARPASGGIAMARIEDRHCSACHTQVSSQDEDRVKAAQQVVLCENCGRILA